MGEKYKLNFLSDMKSASILNDTLSIMNTFGWTYNKIKQGKYAYWKNSPLWNFEDSEEITENTIDVNDTTTDIKRIIDYISMYFSPLIYLNKIVSDEIATATISIIESSTNAIWKELAVTFELNDLIKSSNDIPNASVEAKNIFISIANKVKPFYAIAGTETNGLVDNPVHLKVSDEILGDFNYFSDICLDFCVHDIQGNSYEIVNVNDTEKFIFTTDKIGYGN